MDGNEIRTRANRALSGHTLKALASGAAAAVNAQLAADAATLRLRDAPNLGEDGKYPIQPIVTVGAAMAIEAAWIAFNQEMFRAAERDPGGAQEEALEGDGQVRAGGGGDRVPAPGGGHVLRAQRRCASARPSRRS